MIKKNKSLLSCSNITNNNSNISNNNNNQEPKMIIEIDEYSHLKINITPFLRA
jgi:hypothetical protein